MDVSLLETVPEAQREAAKSALSSVCGRDRVAEIERVRGGASGALTCRITANGRDYLLRIETNLDSPFRNPHQYDCMRIAAEAGVAPALHYADTEAGIAVMDFLSQRPIAEYPGGPPALARDLGRLIATLQATPGFPRLKPFSEVVQGLFGFLLNAGVFADGLLDEHAEGFERINEAYRWHPDTWVSSHNDPNPNNVLFDGERLWLVDWESAFRNDPLTDVAILTQYLAPTPDLELVLVESWLGRAPQSSTLARLTLMRQLTRIYYAGLLFMVAARSATSVPETDLDAPTAAEFGAALAAGKHAPGLPETMRTLGKMSLAGFLAELSAPGFEEALSIVSESGSERGIHQAT